MLGTDMRRRYVRKSGYYQFMIGTTFKSLGEYLDECCRVNAITDDGCPVWPQCRKWWDNRCKVTSANLGPAEIEAIVEKFEDARQEWLRTALLAESQLT